MPFATAADLEDWLGVGTLDASRATVVLDAATGAIQGWTRQTISEVAGDAVELRGTWKPVLELPERPVTAVTSVSVDGVAQTVDDDYVVVRNELRRPEGWDSQLRFSVFGPEGWGGPDVVVAVTYTHGFATVPDDVKGVCLQLAGRMYLNPEAAAMKVIDGHTFQYGLDFLALTDGEKATLRKYRRTSRAAPTW